MPEPSQRADLVRRFSFKNRLIGFFAFLLVKVFSLTFRWRLVDEAGISENPPEKPMIWILWHNAIFPITEVYKRYLKTRDGAVLTSASKDGEMIAAFVAMYGLSAVRGSSSRRGAAAMLGLANWIKDGFDVAVVPDGPRGPRYRLGPGVIKLAEVTGAAILPIRFSYGSAWVLKSWDRFRIPKPFTTLTVTLGPCEFVGPLQGEEAFEAERLRIEQVLNPDNETD